MESDSEISTITSQSNFSEEEFVIVPESEPVIRTPENRITSKYMTKYEKAYILGVRATQLSMNAPPLIEIGDLDDAYEIAMKELKEAKIPFILKRKLPDNSYECWNIKDMVIPE
ncbi:DNA-directed RNA polymerases IV and V subunit 6A-like isoformX1 [Tubulinosema ratisbonensis]|uniref:DNA-directed RNA polymerases IV and V subunit 6A-like isoformX1 n=1 Tax=Tubulinosema ratisbonensis TaxID=291195 RepID=A0A437AM05_9MICR|nr:DNA-directed RNA polymerases IV and V subunit 6A-like isoformX1 [Tubulinosema ratisbonensis]